MEKIIEETPIKEIPREDEIPMETDETEERIWIPYEELKAYLDHVTVALMNVVSSIETSLSTIEKNAANKGDSNE